MLGCLRARLSITSDHPIARVHYHRVLVQHTDPAPSGCLTNRSLCLPWLLQPSFALSVQLLEPWHAPITVLTSRSIKYDEPVPPTL